MPIEPYHPDHLPQLTELVNSHLGAAIPGWSLPAEYIEKRLSRNPGQAIIDPWVIERKTLCVLEHQRVVAAAHLLHYGTDENVNASYQNAGDIAWLLASSDRPDAAQALLNACHDQMYHWRVGTIMIWESCLPSPCLAGIPHAWPHILRLFNEGGYEVVPDTAEAIYGGRLDGIPLPGPAPVAGVEVRRMLQGTSVSFVAYAGDQAIGRCSCDVDLTEGYARPALQAWAELSNMHVEEEWRSRGLGTWLVRHAVEWMRLAGRNRIIFSVLPEDDDRGAGRFYQRFGWQPLTHLHAGWRPRAEK